MPRVLAMTDRSRRVPPSRSAATKARELEADANQKEVRPFRTSSRQLRRNVPLCNLGPFSQAQLQDLRNKVSQEKQEIDKLMCVASNH